MRVAIKVSIDLFKSDENRSQHRVNIKPIHIKINNNNITLVEHQPKTIKNRFKNMLKWVLGTNKYQFKIDRTST